MVNCFIEVKKSDLVRKLKELKIRNKYHDSICVGVRSLIKDSLNDFIDQSIEQNRVIEGVETLEKYQENKEEKV